MSVMVVVDRLEGEWAVLQLLNTSDTFDVPRAAMPADVAEGRVYELGWVPRPEIEAARRADLAARVGRLTEDDDGGDIEL